MSDYGFTTFTQENKNPIVLDGEKSFKGVKVKAGSGLVKRGQLLARERSSNKYKPLKTAVQVTNATLTTEPSTLTSKVFCTASLASVPAIPGTVVLHGTVSASPVTISDNAEGGLIEDSGKAIGSVDYCTGKLGVFTTASMASTDTFSGSYKHFGNAGNLDPSDIVVNYSKEFTAGDDDVDINALSRGNINVNKLTPAIDRTDLNLQKLFSKSGLRLEIVDVP